jgi:capsid protein
VRGPLDHVRAMPESAPTRHAGYDVAKSTRENAGRWADADALHPVAQLTPAVRRTQRNRSRHEAINNCYVAGIVRTLVRDTVGTGPRLQMLTGDTALDEGLEELWGLWTAATNMALNFRVMAGVRYVAAECFGLFRDSKRLDRLGLPVTLDVRLIEPEQVTDGIAGMFFNVTGDDGIVCDADGEVEAYRILKHHPGDNRLWTGNWQPDVVPAANVVHWFQPDRPGQLRGSIPLAPALDDLAQLRRFEKATLTGAEFRASVNGVLESDLQPPTDEPVVSEEKYFDTVEVVRGMLLTLPSGVKANFPKELSPSAEYSAYVNSKLRKIGRAINMPFGKVAGDHSGYNYSSGRMDDAPYWSDRDIERQELQAKVFDPVFYRFCDFARFALPALAAFKGRFWELKHCWHYDARPSSDPEKDARGDELNLTNVADDLYGIAARDGTTVEAILKQRRRTLDLFKKYDIPPPPWAVGVGVMPVKGIAPPTADAPKEAPANA